MTDPARQATAAAGLDGGWCQRRLACVEVETVGHDGVVTSLNQRDQPQRDRSVLPAGDVGRVTGPAQQSLHAARPVLVLDLDQRLLFAQMMRTPAGKAARACLPQAVQQH